MNNDNIVKIKINYIGGSEFKFNSDRIYGEWLKKNCEKKLPLQPKYVIKMNNYESFQHISNKIISDIEDEDTNIFAIVKYDNPFHVAGLLIRTDQKTVEYIDTMPAPQSFGGNNVFKRFADYIKYKYFGLDEIYGETKEWTDVGYIDNLFVPPQNAENVFIGSDLSNENEKIKYFAKRYKSYEGGTCIFWTYHIVNQVIKHNITVKDFIQSSGWYGANSYLEIGGKIVKYIVNQITNELFRCAKSRLKKTI